MRKHSIGFTFLILSLFFAQESFGSTPRLAAKFGQDCRLCHQNPAGAGMRNVYASSLISVLELPITEGGGLEDPFGYQPFTYKGLSFGADFRSLASYDGGTDASQLINMQGNFYLNFRPIPQMQLYYSNMLRGRDELFGVAHILPLEGYIRFGRFTPHYGLNMPDHRAFIRERLGFAADIPNGGAPSFIQSKWDTGISLGLYPGPFEFDVGVYNGSSGTVDFDKEKAASARVGIWHEFYDVLKINLGGSFYRNDLFDGARKGKMFGAFGMLGYKEFALLAEVDKVQTEDAGMPELDDLIFTVEADHFIRKGVDLKLRYDSADYDDQSPSPDWSVISGGVKLYPYFMFETTVMYRYNVVDGLKDFGTIDVQFHIFF